MSFNFTTSAEERQIDAARSSDHIDNLMNILERADNRIDELEELLTEKDREIKRLEDELEELTV